MWLMPADLGEPIAERMIQAGLRWAGIASFVVALGASGSGSWADRPRLKSFDGQLLPS